MVGKFSGHPDLHVDQNGYVGVSEFVHGAVSYRKRVKHMLNPFNPEENSDPAGFFSGLRFERRLLKNIDAAQVEDQIFQVIQNALEEALKKEHIMVMPEIAKKHLLARVMKHVLGNMLKKIDSRKPARFL